MEGNSPNELYNPEENYTMPGTGDSPFNPSSIMNAIGDYYTNNGGANLLERGALVGSAINQYNNAGKYMDLAGKYANEMNPFDLAQRQYYQGKLRQSYEDPTTFLSDPGHRATQEQQLNKLQSRLRAQGYMGSGKEGMDLSDYITQSDNQYLQKEREMLGGFGGSNIGPSAAAGLIQTGITGSINSQNNALGNLTQALSPRSSQGGSSGGTSSNPLFNTVNDPALQGLVKAGIDSFGNTIVKNGAGVIKGILNKAGEFIPSDPGMDFGQDPGSDYGGGYAPSPGDADPTFGIEVGDNEGLGWWFD